MFNKYRCWGILMLSQVLENPLWGKATFYLNTAKIYLYKYLSFQKKKIAWVEAKVFIVWSIHLKEKCTPH